MRHTFALFCCLLAFTSLSAQEFHGGFRAGLNFIALEGPSEMNMAGESLETFNSTTGFHVGATFALAFTDLFGLKADFMYSQKGGEIQFDGPSKFYLYNNADDRQGDVFFGNMTSEIALVNSYLDIPLVAYYRIGSLEVEGGFSAGFLVSSRATGGQTFTNTEFGQDREIVFNVDGSFFSDEAGFNGIITPNGSDLGTGIQAPAVISPYYNSDRDDPLFRRLDFGLIAGVSYFLNSGLYVGVRYQYGLTDVSKGENDLRLLNENDDAERRFNADDEDFNRTFQASVGFRF